MKNVIIQAPKIKNLTSMKYVLSLFVIFFLFTTNSTAEASEEDRKLELALEMATVKKYAKFIHDRADIAFEKHLEKSKLRNASNKLILDFKSDYTNAVEKHLSEESIKYSIAFHISHHLTLDQLENDAKFYATPLGKKVEKNILNKKLATHGLSKEETKELFKLYKQYGVLELLSITPELMKTIQKSLLQKVDKLTTEHKALEAEYLIRYSNEKSHR
ncbi:hypothetical protein [Marinibactrum halimedae]|uniref:DUF2059 domain-containing protein n=1 Tax=Marinibactrum halimedae TaxID=1444977 RepID=A0AA37TCL0_9GAMM|nr:hypothetical protein [Marinibactrum halimedae]MCD9460882.1 hypothetical protein [Marinibactrum halimedae]GLS27340.1 hypothetical protein GCM10007877_30590 [Marinibactrum halimedae]